HHEPFDAGVRDLADLAQVADIRLRQATQPLTHRALRPLDVAGERARISVRIDDLTETGGKSVLGVEGRGFSGLEHGADCNRPDTKMPEVFDGRDQIRTFVM